MKLISRPLILALIFLFGGAPNVPFARQAAQTHDLNNVTLAFDVRIELVDNNGQPVGSHGLQGFWAKNLATGQYIYPNYYSYDQFLNLPAGTFTFGAFDGYFDGASSETLTIGQSLTGSDGFIVVQLVYWSE